jgi:2-polyprenyl-3-methyl-5-hydroxy-6-metoxy-1,4-benzoquinol methylase
MEKVDISTQKIPGQYDVIFFIDVIEHIVAKEKLAYALQNISAAMLPGGTLFLTPIVEESRPHLFHNSEWALKDILPFFEGWEVSPNIAFRGNKLVVLKKPLSQ